MYGYAKTLGSGKKRDQGSAKGCPSFIRRLKRAQRKKGLVLRELKGKARDSPAALHPLMEYIQRRGVGNARGKKRGLERDLLSGGGGAWTAILRNSVSWAVSSPDGEESVLGWD